MRVFKSVVPIIFERFDNGSFEKHLRECVDSDVIAVSSLDSVEFEPKVGLRRVKDYIREKRREEK